MFKYDTPNHKDRGVEFKSYGLYSEVAAASKTTQQPLTIDQIDSVYSWYIKNTVKELLEGDSIQAMLKGLGKIRFNPKKGMSATRVYIEKITSIMEYYNVLKDRVAAGEESVKKLTGVYNLILNRYDKIVKTLDTYIIRLHKMNSKGAISKDQYEYNINRHILLSQKTKEIYESIQRISTTHEEWVEKYR